MLTTFYPPYHFGGDAIGIQRLARGLARSGHDVTVVHDVDAYHALHPGEPTPSAPEPEGVHVIPLRSGVGMLSPLLTQQAGRPVMNGRRIARLLADGNFDVVNFHNISLLGGPALLAYGGDAVKIYMAHEHWLVCPTHVLWRHQRELCTGRECLRCTLRHGRPPQLWRYTGLLQRQLGNVDAFVAMSEFSRAKHREFGFPTEMEVLPYFLPDSEPSAPADAHHGSPHARPYFLYVGRLERIKGLDDVIPALDSYQDADLLIAGDGEHAPVLRELARGNDRIRFLGRLSPEELRAYYEHAIALIVPSVCYETFGIVLIESFRQGTPVIARRLGPFVEIVEQSGAGMLFASTDELTVAMHSIQSDPALRARLAAAGPRALRERWSENVVVPQYLDIVRRAADRRGARHVSDVLSTREVA